MSININPNTTAHILMMRHGDKDDDKLTREGYFQTYNVGGKILSQLDNQATINGLHSQTQRTAQSAHQVIMGYLFNTNRHAEEIYTQETPALNWPNYTTQELQKLEESMQANNGDAGAYILNRNQTLSTTPYQIATNVTNGFLKPSLEAMQNLESGNTIITVGATHACITEATLQEILKVSFTEKFGAAFVTAEHALFTFENDANENLNISVRFREQTHQIDPSLILNFR